MQASAIEFDPAWTSTVVVADETQPATDVASDEMDDFVQRRGQGDFRRRHRGSPGVRGLEDSGVDDHLAFAGCGLRAQPDDELRVVRQGSGEAGDGRCDPLIAGDDGLDDALVGRKDFTQHGCRLVAHNRPLSHTAQAVVVASGAYSGRMDDVVLRDGTVVPERELRWRFSPTGGPGGQHANRSATRAELTFDLDASTALRGHQKEAIRSALGARMRAGTVVVHADETRSQARNRSIARDRLAAMLSDALEVPKTRTPTKPSAAARKRRRDDKQARSRTKKLRKRPEYE